MKGEIKRGRKSITLIDKIKDKKSTIKQQKKQETKQNGDNVGDMDQHKGRTRIR